MKTKEINKILLCLPLIALVAGVILNLTWESILMFIIFLSLTTPVLLLIGIYWDRYKKIHPHNNGDKVVWITRKKGVSKIELIKTQKIRVIIWWAIFIILLLIYGSDSFAGFETWDQRRHYENTPHEVPAEPAYEIEHQK